MSPEVLQQLNFSQGPLRQYFLAKDIGDLLDSNPFVGLGVNCSTVSRELSVILHQIDPPHSEHSDLECAGAATRMLVAAVTACNSCNDIPDNAICTLA
jgi:hypothetical protein